MNLIPSVHNTNFCKQTYQSGSTAYWQTVWAYHCGQTKWQIHKTEIIIFQQHRWWAVITLESMRNQCRVQRKFLIVQLNSRPVRRIELYPKVCNDRVLERHMVSVETWILPMGNVWPNRLELCVVTTPHSLVCLHRPYFWTDYWQVLNLLWGKFTPVYNRIQSSRSKSLVEEAQMCMKYA